MKLFKMGKTSQLRFAKLARLFSKKLKLNNRFNRKSSLNCIQNTDTKNEVYTFKGEDEVIKQAAKFHENEKCIKTTTNTSRNRDDYNY